jgi:hypothetical protein
LVAVRPLDDQGEGIADLEDELQESADAIKALKKSVEKMRKEDFKTLTEAVMEENTKIDTVMEDLKSMVTELKEEFTTLSEQLKKQVQEGIDSSADKQEQQLSALKGSRKSMFKVMKEEPKYNGDAADLIDATALLWGAPPPSPGPTPMTPNNPWAKAVENAAVSNSESVLDDSPLPGRNSVESKASLLSGDGSEVKEEKTGEKDRKSIKDGEKGNKKFAGLRKSKKLKLERDDFDTSLYVVSDKVEMGALVEQEMAKLNLGDDWKELLSPPENGQIVAVVRHRAFTTTVSIMILLNVICVAIESEVAVNNAREGEGSGMIFIFVDVFFCLFFMCEIGLRLFGERIIFFIGPEKMWNWMDFIFVALDIMNQLFTLVFSGIDLSYVSSFRTGIKMVRLVRTARALRMVRVVRESTRARLLLEETIASATLGMALIMILLVVLTFFGLFFMQASADLLLSIAEGSDTNSTDVSGEVLETFGSSTESVFSLFALASGGRSWLAIFHSLMEVDIIYGLVFFMFVFFTLVLFLNVVTAVFVDSAIHRSAKK